MDKLIKLSEIFNVTLDELIKDENDKKENSDITSNNTNSQKLAGMVIKILKGVGIFFIVILTISILLIIIGFVTFNKIVNTESNTTVVEIQEENNLEFKK